MLSEDIINECFEKNEYYDKMMEMIKTANDPEGENHHIIPRAYFKAKGIDVIDEDNLVKLSRKNHTLIHYYIAKCCKDIIKEPMLFALNLMSDSKVVSEEELKNVLKPMEIRKMKKVVCLDTAVVYPSLKEASEKTGVREESIRNVNNHLKYSSHGLHFEWATKDEYTAEECKAMIRTYVQPTTRVKCLETGIEYDSISEALRKTGIPKTTFTTRLNSENGWIRLAPKNTIDCSPTEIICRETGEVFPSIADCVKKEGMDRRSLTRIINTEKTIDKKHYQTKDYIIPIPVYKGKKKIICIELKKVFNTIEEANAFFGVKKSKVSDVLRGCRATSMNAHWEYYDPNKDYNSEEFNYRCHFIKSLKTGKIYESLRQAAEAEHSSRETIKSSPDWVPATFEEYFEAYYRKAA